MKEIIHTSHAPEPIGPYSQAVKTGNMYFLSGQIAINPNNGELISGSLEKETNQVMQNVGAVLKSCGLDYHNIIKVSIFLRDMSDFPEVNEVYAGYFKDSFPARETVAVAGLPKNVNVEISVIAAQ